MNQSSEVPLAREFMRDPALNNGFAAWHRLIKEKPEVVRRAMERVKRLRLNLATLETFMLYVCDNSSEGEARYLLGPVLTDRILMLASKRVQNREEMTTAVKSFRSFEYQRYLEWRENSSYASDWEEEDAVLRWQQMTSVMDYNAIRSFYEKPSGLGY